MSRCARRRRLLVAVVTAAAATSFAAPPATSPVGEAQLARGRVVRGVLLDLLERSYAEADGWPATLPAAAPSGLAYTPPSGEVPPEERHTFTTVVVHESPADHPDGVWAGYADGHMEFAPDAAALAECMAQDRLRRGAPKHAEPARVGERAAGELV